VHGVTRPRPEIVYVDVDDTLVRSAGTKRIPMAPVVDRVRALKREGATLYCWSTGGAEYAREAALELGLEDCFAAYLPKPTVILDDQPPAAWRLCRYVHPFNVASIDTET
jgi:hypothetical protein